MNRRSFVRASVGSLLAAGARAGAQSPLAPESLPGLWDADRSVANLENAYWSAMPREIADEYIAHTQFLNRRNVVFVRDAIAGQERTVAMERVRDDVAALMGAPKDEFALTRNGTESLQNLIMQYGRLRPGDAVLYADLDYDEMQQAMDSPAPLSRRHRRRRWRRSCSTSTGS